MAHSIKPVLCVVTSHPIKGDTGQPTGFWLSELTHALAVLQDAGIPYHLASVRGGQPPIDGFDLSDKVNARYWDDALAAPTARGMVEHLLREAANFLSDECNPRGCLMVRSVVSCGDAAEAIQQQLAAQRSEAEARVRARLERAKDEGLMPPDLDPGDFARYLMAVMEGMAVRAAGGAGRQELERIAEMALRMWPA